MYVESDEVAKYVIACNMFSFLYNSFVGSLPVPIGTECENFF